MGRSPEPEEETLDGEVLKQLLERPVLLPGTVQEPLMDGLGQVGALTGRHRSISMYGSITRSTRQIRP